MNTQGVRARWVLLAVAGAAAALFAAPSAASAAPAPGTGGLVQYSASNPQATHVVLQGTRVAGGCQFTTIGKGATSAARVRQVETAFNAQTCTSYLDQVAAAPVAKPAVSARVASCLNPFRSTSTFYLDDACIHSWFQDGSGNHVTDVRNEVQWNPSGGCATAGADFASYYAFRAAGWSQTLNSFTSSFSCAGVTSQTSQSFQSTTFCSGTSVTTFDPGFVTGHGDGSYNWSVTWRKSSSCTLAFGLLDES
ncbi:MAG TPA: hypothetical protein VJT31_41335 [Rugosimonospora sp.]|nr:hypothetical protein [Rugosimonospora sp.]